MNIQSVLFYGLTWSLIAVAPGPSVLCAMSHASRFGLRPALRGIAGMQLGTLAFFACVASGLSALLAAAPAVVTLIRIAGAVYLCLLGLKLILAPWRRPRTGAAYALPTDRSLFLQGLVIQVTNPKILLFMFTLLPQFIDSGHALPVQIAVLLAVTVAVHVVVLSAYALLAQRGAQSLRSGAAIIWLRRATGGALVLVGIRLLTAGRT